VLGTKGIIRRRRGSGVKGQGSRVEGRGSGARFQSQRLGLDVGCCNSVVTLSRILALLACRHAQINNGQVLRTCQTIIYKLHSEMILRIHT
jgi:hypothetical protein